MDNLHLLPRGTVIGGKYEVLREIGQGGMSVVYLVMDTHLNKNWALKEVRRDLVQDFEVVKQGLVVETNMLKKLSHPFLPRIVDVIETEGVFYVVMDYIEGMTLKQVLDEYGAQPQDKVIEWAIDLCEVLNYLHTRKPEIIYRDMKPGNIMLKPEGGIVLFDFGIAREFKEKNVADTTCLGTIGYAAPEQFGGQGQTTERTDIYGLGATLYHLVTGMDPSAPPYEMVPIRQVNPGLSSGLEKIILKCTQRNPDDRYQSCAELMYALEHYNEMDVEYQKNQRNKLVAFLVPLVIGLISAGVAVFSYFGLQTQIRNNYMEMLSQANDAATQSLYADEYDVQVVNLFTETIDIDPSIQDAYTRLLSYCNRIGETSAGLNAVCTRIDAGAGNIDENTDIVMEVAEIYFGGNPYDSEFTVDYTLAAKYFSMIDEAKEPGVRYYSALSSALGSFSSDIQWDEISSLLDDFSLYNEGQTLNQNKVRNYMLSANVYTANKRNLKAVGIDPYEKAIDLLKKAYDDVEILLTDVRADVSSSNSEETELEDIQRQIVSNLASNYSMAYTIDSAVGDYDASLDYYSQLLTLTDNAEDIQSIYFRMADVYVAKGDSRQTRDNFDSLIKRYPNTAKSYLSYASWLYEQGDADGSADMYRRAGRCADAEEDSNYQRLGTKLKNAGKI